MVLYWCQKSLQNFQNDYFCFLLLLVYMSSWLVGWRILLVASSGGRGEHRLVGIEKKGRKKVERERR